MELGEILTFDGTADLLRRNSQSFASVVEFLNDVEAQLTRAGAKLRLVPERSVPFIDDESQVNGYWDQESMILVAAVAQPFEEWLSLVAHEFAHFRQWIEHREPYTAVMEKDKDGVTFEDKFWEWLDGRRKLSKRKVKKYAGMCRELELDCERRTLMLIDEYSLPLSKTKHSKRSAAYVYFYNILVKTKKWYEIGNEPYNNPDVLNLMPTDLDGDFSKTPKDVEAVLMKECYGE